MADKILAEELLTSYEEVLGLRHHPKADIVVVIIGVVVVTIGNMQVPRIIVVPGTAAGMINHPVRTF